MKEQKVREHVESQGLDVKPHGCIKQLGAPAPQAGETGKEDLR